MNIRLSGAAPEFAGFVFEVRDGAIASRPVDPATAKPGGLATAIVFALAGSLSVDSLERGLGEGVDQTNESVIVGDRWIVKHIARWGTADRGALIERALADAGSTDVPSFLGSVEWDHPTLGTATIALASDYVADARDGWTWAVDDVIEAIDPVLTPGDPESMQGDPEWPARLGELAARVHADLARADLPMGEVRALADGSAARIAAELTELYAARRDPAARRMSARLPAILRESADLPAGWTPNVSVAHGDLHVGQVIRTPGGRYLLLDFDGDPQSRTPFPREPLERDLAHLQNSIDLVAAVAQRRVGRVDLAFWEWADRAQAQCLAGYQNAGGNIIDGRALSALRAEQLLFELRYAAHYLPEWEYAPDGVISHRYSVNTTEEAPPWTPPDSSKT